MHATCPLCDHSWSLFEPMIFGNIELVDIGTVRLDDSPVHLSRREFELTEALVRARGRGLTRGQISCLIDDQIDAPTITKYVERTRAAFRDIDPAFDQIAALRGFGAYRWIMRQAPASDREMH